MKRVKNYLRSLIGQLNCRQLPQRSQQPKLIVPSCANIAGKSPRTHLTNAGCPSDCWGKGAFSPTSNIVLF